MKLYDKMLINPNKRYNFMVGGRGQGRMYFLLQQKQNFLEEMGDCFRQGFIQLTPSEERAHNWFIVGMMKTCGEMRKRNQHL